jgi:hypothetical protein
MLPVSPPFCPSPSCHQVFAALERAPTGDHQSEGTTDSDNTATSVPAPAATVNGNGKALPPMLCVVLCTDGVWDNWTYEVRTPLCQRPPVDMR